MRTRGLDLNFLALDPIPMTLKNVKRARIPPHPLFVISYLLLAIGLNNQ